MRKTLALILFLTTLSSKVFAKDYPYVEGGYWAKLSAEKVNSYKDHNALTNDDDLESADTYLEANPFFKLNFSKIFSLNTSWLLLNVKSVERQGADRLLDDEGLVMEELFVNFEGDDGLLSVGKLNIDFGSAWKSDLKSGLWGSDFGDQYRITGKLGAKVAAKFDLEDYGNHKLSITSFYNDDSGLNDSVITRRDEANGSVGQAGNNGGLSSYALTLGGKDIYSIPNLFYKISYRNLDPGNSAVNVDDEEGYSLTAGSKFEPFTHFNVVPFIEYAKIHNFNSVNNRYGPEFGDNNMQGDYKYLSMMLSIIYSSWDFHFNRLEQDYFASVKGGADQTEYSITYNFKNNVSLGAGRKIRSTSNGVEVLTYGLTLSLSRDF